LLQFQLDVKYCLNKQHIISNAFSRLSIAKSTIKAKNSNIEALDLNTYYNEIIDSKVSNQVYIYQDTIIVILSKFKKSILDKYAKKKS